MFQLRCGCGLTRPGLTRRGLLAGLGTTLAAAALPARAAGDGLVDVHHHLYAPDYVARIGRRTPLLPVTKDWTPELSLADMDRAGIATSILSITTPGLWFGDEGEAREVARASNEYAAELTRRFPGRFGSFAALPLPDVEGSLAEIAYAFDKLGADGVMMFTSYATSWLGDEKFAPVMAELNRRRAVLYTHPTGNQCCVNLMPFIPETAIEYGTDTTRTIASLMFSGASRKYPDIKFIFSHAGGTAPFLMERFRFMAKFPANAGRFPNGVDGEMRRFHYDTAQAFDPITMAAFRTMVPASQILFGTDYPYRNGPEHVAGLAKIGFSAAEMRDIGRGNAARLIPRLAA